MKHFKGGIYMAIILRYDRMMVDRKMSLNQLSDKVRGVNVYFTKLKN